MLAEVLITLVNLMPKIKEKAITSEELKRRFYERLTIDKRLAEEKTKNTAIRRYLDELQEMNLLTVILQNSASGKGHAGTRYERYYLKDTSLLRYFMSSDLALNVLWAQRVAPQLNPVINLQGQKDLAQMALKNNRQRALINRLRIVPDGLGRCYADIDKDVLKTLYGAVEEGHMVQIDYRHARRGQVERGKFNDGEFTVLGMVVKDGTIYAILCKGLDDKPRHLALHRIRNAEISTRRSIEREDFDLDKYIEEQHNFSHVMSDQDSPIDLVLKVHKDAHYHFKERPLTRDQKLSEKPDVNGWHTLSARVPFTIQLPPFLWSHAGWVRVVEPKALRDYVAKELARAHQLYQEDFQS